MKPFFDFRDNLRKKIQGKIYDLVYPKKCVGCGIEGEWLCGKCFNKIVIVKAPFCPTCQRMTMMGQYCPRCRSGQYLTGVIIAAHYEEPLKEAIHRFKYDRVADLGGILSEFIVMRLEAGFPRGDLVLAPVPLHRRREAERGFNQALVLARKIGADFDLPLINDVLKRVKEVEPQMKLKRTERLKNILGAFEARGDVRRLTGKTVLLVDDVMTTGATLNEAGRVLREAGARNVWGLVLAKG